MHIYSAASIFSPNLSTQILMCVMPRKDFHNYFMWQYITNYTLDLCRKKKTNDGGVKESLKWGFYWADWRSEREKKGDSGEVGRVRGDRYGKGRKNYQRHLTCSSSHYFPQFLSLENMQQHTKTATTCSLQAPCNNSLGLSPVTTIPYFNPLRRLKLTWATLTNGLTFQ